MTASNLSVAVNPVKQTIPKLLMLLTGLFVFTILNHYFETVVHPLVFPLGVLAVVAILTAGFGRLLRELHRMSAKVEAAEEMASNAALQIVELRADLDRHNKPVEAKAVGFTSTTVAPAPASP